MNYSQDLGVNTELVFGIVGPIGCNRELVIQCVRKIADKFSYSTAVVHVSDLIKQCERITECDGDQYHRVIQLMDAGNKLREKDDAALAKLAAVEISKKRLELRNDRAIYIVDSLKHKSEIKELRNIYGRGFYVFAIHSSEESRNTFLEDFCNIADLDKRKVLISRDRGDDGDHAQNTSEAFHLADFFLTENGNNMKVYNSLERFMDIIFGDPFRTPTFHEYAMFTAHTSAMRSADMSRQVGAVIARSTDIISTGANECPKAGGGSYWPLFDEEKNLIYDVEGGRDYMVAYEDEQGRECVGFDYNTHQKLKLIASIKKDVEAMITGGKNSSIKDTVALARLLRTIKKNVGKQIESNIKASGLDDITEYGRVVHAEMDAILGCARRGVSCKNAVLFCTTFPCHNCAKHIISSGIKSVIYIEPYPKSKALEMHKDAIATPEDFAQDKVLFVPFVGVGPRQFVNLFSMSLGSGSKIARKSKKSASRTEFDRAHAQPRVKMFSLSYKQVESYLASKTKGLLLEEHRSESEVAAKPSKLKSRGCGERN